MEAIYVRIFTTENRRHHGKLLYEWLLEEARSMGIEGGSALRAIAGYGRHGRLHEQGFFELAGDLPVELVFVLPEPDADRLLARIAAEGLSLMYFRSRVEQGFTGA